MKRIPRSEQEKIDKRLEALNVADAINRLVQPSVFPILLDAVDSGDNGKTKFKQACAAAYIPKDMEKYLWNVVMKKSIYKAKYEALEPVDAAYCW